MRGRTSMAGVPGSSQPRLPAAARAALAGRVRGGGTPGRPGDRRTGLLRRPLHRPRRVRRDPLSQLRVRAGLPAHVPRPDPGRPGLLAARERYAAGRAPARRAAPLPAPPRSPTATLQRHRRGERRAASRIHDGRLRHRGGRDPSGLGPARRPAAALPAQRRVGEAEATAVEEAVRQIRLLDDRHGADGLYRRAAQPLRAAYALLDAGTTPAARPPTGCTPGRANSPSRWAGWRMTRAASTTPARTTRRRWPPPGSRATPAWRRTPSATRPSWPGTRGAPARRYGRRRPGSGAARPLASPRLLSLLALREAGGWAGLADRTGCEQALARAHTYFGRGARTPTRSGCRSSARPELEALEAQCWSALGDMAARRPGTRAGRRRSRTRTSPGTWRCTRAELAADLARRGRPRRGGGGGPPGAGPAGPRSSPPASGRCWRTTARVLRAAPARSAGRVGGFLDRHAATRPRRRTAPRAGLRPGGRGRGRRAQSPVQVARVVPALDRRRAVGPAQHRQATSGPAGCGRAKETSRPSQRAPSARRMWPCAKTSTSRSAERAQSTTSSARAATSAERLAVRDPVAPDEPARPDPPGSRPGSCPRTRRSPTPSARPTAAPGPPKPASVAGLAGPDERAGADLDARQARPRAAVQPLAQQLRAAPALVEQRDVRPAGVLARTATTRSGRAGPAGCAVP